MKISKSIIVGFVLWVFAMGAIIFFPLVKERVFERGNYDTMQRMEKYKAAFYALSHEDKEAVVRAAKGLVIFNDGKIRLVDESCENMEELVCMDIGYTVSSPDVEGLIIKYERKSINNQLPYVEQMLIDDHKATLMRGEDGQYFLIANRDAVVEYREKYKIGCKTCN